MRWYNEGLASWQTWHPHADAPPLPPGWEPIGYEPAIGEPAAGGKAAGGKAARGGEARGKAARGGELAGTVSKPVLGLRISRPRWRSPYRIVPIVLAVFVVAVALFQSVGHSRTGLVRAETKAADALLGQCLAQHGTKAGHPSYSTTTVRCSSSAAAVKVVKVLPGTPGSPSCPAGTVAMQIPYQGVRYPHVECAKALSAPR